MIPLAKQFSVLENAPGVDDWNPIKLDEWAATVASSGSVTPPNMGVKRVANSNAEWRKL
jgi:hypothetical protein